MKDKIFKIKKFDISSLINKFKEIMELKNFKGIGLYNYNNNKILL